MKAPDYEFLEELTDGFGAYCHELNHIFVNVKMMWDFRAEETPHLNNIISGFLPDFLDTVQHEHIHSIFCGWKDDDLNTQFDNLCAYLNFQGETL